MNRIYICLLLALTLFGCTNAKKENVVVTQKTETPPIKCIEVYTLGNVSDRLRDAMVDSLKKRYPKCKFVKNLNLPSAAITTKRNEHVRYRADLLNLHLSKMKNRNNIVVGLTSEDIGLDGFRNSAHYGIRGLANGYGKGVAVFSNYRGNENELFRLMQHELAHAFGLHHCPNKGCVMQDQQGGNKLKNSRAFCESCRSFLKKNHWKY